MEQEEDKKIFDNLTITLTSLRDQELPPKAITIINLSNDIKMGGNIVALFEDIYKEVAVKPKWRVQNVLNSDLTTPDYIDIAVDGMKRELYNFYMVFQSGFQIPLELGNEIDILVNEKLQTFYIIKGNEDGNGMIVPVTTHFNYQGNAHGIYLETKVEASLCDENKILQINQLFPAWF
jgi:hypothetical protein